MRKAWFFTALFSFPYLIYGFVVGILLLLKSPSSPHPMASLLFALSAFVLVIGDSFHLIPRSIPIDNETWILKGNLVSSVTMSYFYLFLSLMGSALTMKPVPALYLSMIVLLTWRTVVLFSGRNEWFSGEEPGSNWRFYRNLPFFAIGVLVVMFFLSSANPLLEKIAIAVIISFGCYVPVAIWSNRFRWLGFLMLPKTLAYIYILFTGFTGLR